MLKNIIIIIVIIILIPCILAQLLILNTYIFSNTKLSCNIVKNLITKISPLAYIGNLSPMIYTSGKYMKSNKIDIIICNHINTIDYCINMAVIKKYDDREIYYIVKKNTILIPGMGFVLACADDLKLNRVIEDDGDNIRKFINKLTSGIIIIYPEGTRYTKQKYIDSVKYCEENKLPILKNTLFPKMKGLHLLCTNLINENKMGNIIDLSIIIDNYRHANGDIFTLLNNKNGNTFCVISTYNVPFDNSINEYNDFKKWFVNIWKTKDNMITDIATANDTNIYTPVIHKLETSEYFLLVFIISLFIYIVIITKGTYIPISFLLSYIITYFKHYYKINDNIW